MSDHAHETLHTDRLVLEPLAPAHATEMVAVLADPALYAFTGGAPPTLDELEERYRSQVAGPPEGDERWRNWIVRLLDTGEAIGFVQATVDGHRADVAWTIGVPWQRRGFATEAAGAMLRRLHADGVVHVTAHIHRRHRASAVVAAAVGLTVTTEVDGDGERVWASDAPGRRRASGPRS